MASGMKKINIIISHSEIVDLINELIALECIEPIEPDVTLDPAELTDLLSHEDFPLENYEANWDEITVIATQYTYTLCGWVPDQLLQKLTSTLSRYTCAWEIEPPTSDELEFVPVYVKGPQLFGKFRSSGRKLFEPLAKSNNS